MPNPKKPTALKVIEGTLRPCRENKKEPKLQVEKPTVPSWLSGKAKHAFQELSDVLVGMSVLTRADRKALELLCDAYGEYRDARADVRKNGHTYETLDTSGNSVIKKNPAVDIAANAWKRVQSMLLQFGLTPAARSNVNSLDSNSDEKDPWSDL